MFRKNVSGERVLRALSRWRARSADDISRISGLSLGGTIMELERLASQGKAKIIRSPKDRKRPILYKRK